MSRGDIRKVVEVRLREVQKRFDDNNRKIKLVVDGPAMDWLGSAGYSPSYGARPMARLIQTEILNALSKLLLQNRIREGEAANVTADLRRNRLVVSQPDDSMDEDEDGMDIEVEDID